MSKMLSLSKNPTELKSIKFWIHNTCFKKYGEFHQIRALLNLHYKIREKNWIKIKQMKIICYVCVSGH